MGYKDKALYYYKKGQDNLNQKENKKIKCMRLK